MAKKISSQYTEDWLPVEGIRNGMIICSNKQKVTGVKIAPRNIFILDAPLQIVVFKAAGFLHLQFKIISHLNGSGGFSYPVKGIRILFADDLNGDGIVLFRTSDTAADLGCAGL